MPSKIRDLLAQITGEEAESPAADVGTNGIQVTKRKAEDDLRSRASKTPRTVPVLSGPSRMPQNVPRPARPADISPLPTSASRINLASRAGPDRRPAEPPVRSPVSATTRPRPSVSSGGNGHTDATSSSSAKRPPPPSSSTALASSPSQSAPKTLKKGSYQEIMARAQAAKASMAQVGKIQHKPLEKGPSKRERQELKSGQAGASKKGAGITGSRAAYTGTSRPGAKAPTLSRGPQGSGPAREDRGTTKDSAASRVNGKGHKQAPIEDKKPKKAALATTGYQGTARPPPSATPTKPGQAPSAGPSKVARGPRERRMPFGASRRSAYDEEEDEMDDFIEYDDEVEEEEILHGYGGKKRGYPSHRDDYDSESDMEAGLSDIDEEERRAAYLARKEDEKEEELERRLKREKEERKRRLQGVGAKDARR